MSINKRSFKRVTPLHLACINPDASILQHLIDNGGEIHVGDINGKKPIAYAATCESSAPLKLLLKHKCNANDKQLNGISPLYLAAQTGRYENVKILIENDADYLSKPKSVNLMPIHIAAIEGYLDIVKYLLSKDKEMLNKPGRDRKTCLHFAVIHGHKDIVEYLLSKDAKVNALDKLKRTPLLLACRFGKTRIANLLIQ